ncbi:CxC2 domain-containing protein [Mycena kentingensis (nom. inval.)]|nr:CxC2 domain-containing protein [Mycena kentingensis (nom. inval.)]
MSSNTPQIVPRVHRRARNTSASAETSRSYNILDLIPATRAEGTVQHSIESLTRNRRVHSEAFPVEPSSPVKRLRATAPKQTATTTSTEVSDPFLDDGYTMTLEEQEPFSKPKESSKKRSRPKDPMHTWADAETNHREQFLAILLWLDGRGASNTGACSLCHLADRPARVRCRDCDDHRVLCDVCIQQTHVHHPLHWIEIWDGLHFRRSCLKEIGLRIQMGHDDGTSCSNPLPARSDFVVLHDNGIHEVAVDYCGCYHCQDPPHIQLLRARWYPATTERVKTCSTFTCLDRFHALSLHAKTTVYDYYATLETLTHGSGRKPPNRYKCLLRMTRQYRHLLALKRGGRGHDVGGVLGTAVGQLAIRCPACPRPGINLPVGWEDAPEEQRALYVIFLAIDACFRLKRRLVSSELKDPGLGTGWFYMVEWEPYRQYLLTVTKQMSTCSGLAALDYANTKFSRGYAATGVGMGVCARHEFVQPNGVADLQRGERYANMDWILASILRHLHHRLRKFLSYDIVCQWSKSLCERLAALPKPMRLALILALCRFAIPKMHIKGHTTLCQLVFSFYLLLWSGQTDGEGIERVWAMSGGVAASTKLSGPGARADQLDDHWHHWNWLKYIGLAALLPFEEFSSKQKQQVPEWKAAVERFEEEMDKPEPGDVPNPYKTTVSGGPTEKEVRARFLEEEEAEKGRGVPSIHRVSPSEFIGFALDLEDEQRRLEVQAELKRRQNTVEKINLKKLRRKLNQGIQRLRTLQTTYMPSALRLFETLGVAEDVLPENIPLLLPSALPPHLHDTDGCKPGLVELERQSRDAQCREALAQLRSHLQIKARFLVYKKHQSRHQGANTRTRTLVTRNETKIKRQSDKYIAAQKALCKLAGGAEHTPDDLSKTEARQRRRAATKSHREAELRDAGLIPLDPDADGSEADDGDEDSEHESENAGSRKAGSGESVRTVSWIWTCAGTTGDDTTLQDALRVEWSKAYARVRRWREEVALLEEEWRRLPLSLAHDETVWRKRAEDVGIVSDLELDAGKRAELDAGKRAELDEGKRAYALKQAHMYRDLALRARTRSDRHAGEAGRAEDGTG